MTKLYARLIALHCKKIKTLPHTFWWHRCRDWPFCWWSICWLRYQREDIMLSVHYDRTIEEGDLDNGSKIDTSTGKVIDPNTVNDQRFAQTDNDVANYGASVTAISTGTLGLWRQASAVSSMNVNVQNQTTQYIAIRAAVTYKVSDRHDEWTFDTGLCRFYWWFFDALGVNHRLLVGEWSSLRLRAFIRFWLHVLTQQKQKQLLHVVTVLICLLTLATRTTMKCLTLKANTTVFMFKT